MLARALLVLLLVLNVGVATWWVTRAPPVSPGSVPAPAPVGATRLQLLGESPRHQAAMAAASAIGPGAVAASASALVTTPAMAAAPPQCFSVGPFSDERAAATAQARLLPLAERVAIREQPRSGRGWRVMLPALPDADQAAATAERIAAAGFSDYFVVREGSEIHSIALGRYGNEIAARRRAEALASAGFAARAEPLGGSVTWLDVRAAHGFDAPAAQQLAAAPERRPLDCARLQ